MKMKMSKIILLTLTTPTMGAVTITTNDTNVFQTKELTGFSTSGGQMGGIQVSVVFRNAGIKESTWTVGGSNIGGAVNTGWFEITQQYSTFSNPWTIKNTSNNDNIIRFTLNGVGGNTIFDRTEPNTGTEGSAQGRDFVFTNRYIDLDADILYSGPIALTGEVIVGDLYSQMQVNLGSPIRAGRQLKFIADTDNSQFEIIASIPEPSVGMAILLILSSALLMRSNRNG